MAVSIKSNGEDIGFMEYYAGIIPFIEARLYLSKRFSSERIGELVEKNRFKKSYMPNYDFTQIERIAELERKLDERFEVTELFRYYFKPLKLKEQRPIDPISIGSMLLTSPKKLNSGINIDTLIEDYRSNPQDENIAHFFSSTLFPFGFGDESDCRTLTDFMQATNELLSDPDEKWALVDAATNPCDHLLKLRPLVSAIEEYIRNRSSEFDPIIEHIRKFIFGVESTEFFVSSFHVGDFDMNNMFVYPSLFMFNTTLIIAHPDNSYDVIFGSFNDINYRYRKMARNPETHLSLLKVLADNTRFNVLHELCDNSSYGLELAEKFGITRNAMYYQLDKLAGYGLAKMKYEDHRMLHTMDKRAVFEKLTALRDYLVNGWKPEDYKE